MRYSLTPLGDRLLIRPVELEREGLIIAPPTAAEKPTVGEVVEAGDDLHSDLFPVGSKVLYGKFTGTPVEITGEELLLIRADDILALVTEVEDIVEAGVLP